MIRDTGWFRSSFSGSGNDSCVEVRIIGSGLIGVRDSKDPFGDVFWMRPDAWAWFLARLNRDGLTN